MSRVIDNYSEFLNANATYSFAHLQAVRESISNVTFWIIYPSNESDGQCLQYIQFVNSYINSTPK